jgi:protein phosphatase
MPKIAHITYSIQTDVGKTREHNEDAVAVITTEEKESSSANVLFVVADGVGGLEAGEEASRITIETLRDSYQRKLYASRPVERLSEAIGRAHYKIWQHNITQSSKVGTTVVAALVVDQMLYAAHLGDSRAYLLDYWWGIKPRLQQITRDHTLVAQEISAGKRHDHPLGNVLTQALGVSEEIQIERQKRLLKPGTILLLCSDGLTELIHEPELCSVLSKQPPEAAAEELVRLAHEAGGIDNISAIVAQIGHQPRYSWLLLALTILGTLLIFILLLFFA